MRLTSEGRQLRRVFVEARALEMLTVKEFSVLSREHVDTVRRRIRQGRQPGAYFLGGQWRIDLAECRVLSSVSGVESPAH